jgi:hypothetical protein
MVTVDDDALPPAKAPWTPVSVVPSERQKRAA